MARTQTRTAGLPVQAIILMMVCWLLLALSIGRQARAADTTTLPFKISARMWYAPSGKMIPTPPAIIDKINKVFDLWASVDDAHLRFKYQGLADADYTGPGEVPKDGAIYIVLNNWDMGQCYDGLGSHYGSIPRAYQGGLAVINTKKGIHTVRLDILIHEIGHTLGLDLHGASGANVMNEANHAWGINEYFYLSEQDRADLIAKWNPGFNGLYTISGSVTDGLDKAVFAVNIVNGHTYSAKTDANGNFTIHLLKDGDYRIFAKVVEDRAYTTPVSQCPSWYVSRSQSTNDPYGGTVLHVGNATRDLTGIGIKMIDFPVPFNLRVANQTYAKTGPFCFMRPGAGTTFQLETNQVATVESYGSQPDYTLSALELEPMFKETLLGTVTVNARAEPGERLVIAKGKRGEMTQAGLIGITVVGKAPEKVSPGSIGNIESQLKGGVDFSAWRITGGE